MIETAGCTSLAFEPLSKTEAALGLESGWDRLNDSRLSQPLGRMGHAGVTVAGRYFIIWGGHRHLRSDDSRRERTFDPRRLWEFDTQTETWRPLDCVNEEYDENIPPTLSGSCAIALGDRIYFFGGCRRSVIDGRSDIYYNELYAFDLNTLEWTRCQVAGDRLPSPRAKCAGWHHGDKLFFYGGFGVPISQEHLSEQGDFIDSRKYNPPLGLNGQLVSYDLVRKTWQLHSNAHPTPGPRAGHSCTKLNDSQVVLFGGKSTETRTNDVFILNLQTLTWSRNLCGQEASSQVPAGRSLFVSSRLDDQNLLVLGGILANGDVSNEGWIFNAESLTWTKIRTGLEKRFWMTTSEVIAGNVFVFGGVRGSQDGLQFPRDVLKLKL